MLNRIGVALLPFVVCALTFVVNPIVASGQNWYDAAFPTQHHDFGTVAVGAKTEFMFPVTNTLSSTMHFQSIRASCGCTTPTILNDYLEPGQTGFIKAKFNTDTFRGKKGATLTLVMDQPFYSEIRLKVDGYIRSDMVFHPGSIDFGQVSQGDVATKSSKVLYAGRSDWQIVDIRSNRPWLMPTLKETVRRGGTVNYEITVDVREDAPTGPFQDELVVVTNDRNMPEVPLRVTGNVESALTISPVALALGSLKPGEQVSARFVLIGKTAFEIDSITAEGWDVDFDPSTEPKKMHVIEPRLTYTGNQGGPQKASLVIKTTGEQSVTAKGLITADIRGN
ncbi:DUF1573 domain-containing protein [Rubripirellula amarantea]|uniref:DUF1573 domain-containing protein n=1 Tax=Rubripirellula amarantea TaxID=2527999 RepID=A0A5C5WK17_9BACT|nr:DUF1573 domain-containing protein [Rubripirellula amarantea]MDA8745440.1 DUF1573 domain-containing protein [Rubripirellula amarantea]TWT50479.1 hypothetical protein Pla22_32220 [Rubripirellula amarantea]